MPRDADSEHLVSRKETGDRLRAGSVPVTEVRAGIIVGPGSAAYEVMRDLVYHLPVMVTPKWVQSKSSPIALANLLVYLQRVATLPEAAGRIYDAGGPEYMSYEDMMRQFGEVVGRRPRILRVPVLSPRLSSYWLGLVTAVPGEHRARADRRPQARHPRARRGAAPARAADAADVPAGGRGGARRRAAQRGRRALDRRAR